VKIIPTGTDEIEFGLDLAPPALNITTINGGAAVDWVNGTAKNGTFAVAGTASDANGINKAGDKYRCRKQLY
jgi:hypothetical protein